MSLSRESSEEVRIALGKQGDIFDDLIDLIAERSPDFYEQTALATYAPSRFMLRARSQAATRLENVAAELLCKLGYTKSLSPLAMSTGSAGHLYASSGIK